MLQPARCHLRLQRDSVSPSERPAYPSAGRRRYPSSDTRGSRLLITAGPAAARHRGGHSSFQAKQWAALPSSVLTRPLLPFQLRQIYPIWAAISPAHEVSFLSRFLSSGRFVYSICLRSECAGSEMGARRRAASSVACCDSGGFVVCSRGIGA